MSEQFPQKVTQDTSVTFFTEKFGLYVISITARCKSAKQSESHKNEMLRVEIDDVKLREIPSLNKPQYNKIPSAWDGIDQQGLAKTVIFIIVLNKGKHTLNFFPTNEALIEEWNYHFIDNIQEICLDLEKQAEDGDKRSWYTFALVNIPIQSFIAEVSAFWHSLDGDDVKLIIDGKVQENSFSKLWKYWLWSARPWQLLSKAKKEQKTIELNLTQDIHYIEFWADKTPILHQVIFNLGNFQPKRIPTVNDPEWTGDFADDTDQIILARALFGEIRDTSYSDKARIAVGWSIRNRVKSPKWADTYHEVITQSFQYSAFNAGDPNFELVKNPFVTENKIDLNAWYKAYEIAGKVIRGEVADPTNGANHYHDSSIDPPSFLTSDKLVLTIFNDQKTKSIFFYRL